MVDENRVEGTLNNLGGKVQDAAGGLLGDSGMQAEGKFNQATGNAQAYYGETLDTVRDIAADRPITALAAAAGAGLVIGLLLGRL